MIINEKKYVLVILIKRDASLFLPYYKVDLIGKIDQVQTQQNNVIIALLTSLHYRLTLIENKLLTLEQQILNKDLNKLFTGTLVTLVPRRKSNTCSFLTYSQENSK